MRKLGVSASFSDKTSVFPSSCPRGWAGNQVAIHQPRSPRLDGIVCPSIRVGGGIVDKGVSNWVLDCSVSLQ